MNDPTTSERIEKATREVPLLTNEQKQGLLFVDSQPMNNDRAVAITELVGVLAGLKPSALMQQNWIHTVDIEAVGMSYEVLEDRNFAISRDSVISNYLSEVVQSARHDDEYDPVEGDRQLGKLLGYPDTAVEYYVARATTVNTSDELPIVKSRSLQDTTTEFFQQFILSPDHYEQEINEFLLPLQAAVKSLTPNTYLFIEEQTYRNNEVMRKQDVTRVKIGNYVRYLFTPSRTPEAPEHSDVKTMYVD
jgi:hypothetical protein